MPNQAFESDAPDATPHFYAVARARGSRFALERQAMSPILLAHITTTLAFALAVEYVLVKSEMWAPVLAALVLYFVLLRLAAWVHKWRSGIDVDAEFQPKSPDGNGWVFGVLIGTALVVLGKLAKVDLNPFLGLASLLVFPVLWVSDTKRVVVAYARSRSNN